jgi:hypothetical protein
MSNTATATATATAEPEPIWDKIDEYTKKALLIILTFSVLMIPVAILDKDHENTFDGWFNNIGIMNIILIIGFFMFFAPIVAIICYITFPKILEVFSVSTNIYPVTNPNE